MPAMPPTQEDLRERYGMSLYLVKKDPTSGLAAHIVDTQGKPLCKAQLNLATWTLQASVSVDVLVCYHCRRKQSTTEQTEPSSGPD